MEHKPTRFLRISLVLVSLFYILIFNIQILYMNKIGEETIRQLGVIYMSGMSEQMASHFGTIIELRMSQVKALVDAVPPERIKEEARSQIELNYNARSTGFEYLAYYTSSGGFRMIYGSQVKADYPDILLKSITGGKYNICAGRDEDGTQIVLMGVPAKYAMDGGETSIGLVAGLSTSTLSASMENSVNDTLMEYAIIRNDGSYILQKGTVTEKNYFDWLKSCESYKKEPDEYVRELQNALNYDRDYSCEIKISGERWSVYCSVLPHSEWHLLLKISHNTLDETISVLKTKWSFISIGGCVLIMGAMALVFVGYFRTARKQMHDLDEARKWAERSNRVKNEFLSNMSHDIRTPMNGIMGMTSIAIDNLDNPSRVRTCLKKINVSSRHLLGLLNDMLDLSKIESGTLAMRAEPVFLREIMQNITTITLPQIHEKNQTFNIYIHNIYCEHICTDRVRLTQILLNILGNAVKFTPEGGAIEVNLHEEPSPKGDGYIRSCLHVGDNGIGMSKEFQEKIFEAFAREDNERIDQAAGGGMGMTITKHIVDAMGGTITVDSQKGRGSDFFVTLDLEKAMQQEQEFKLPPLEVLVIDDDIIAARTAKDSLNSIGLNAECVSELDKAFEMIEAHCSSGSHYHMILLDWDMEGKDGIQLAKELCRRFNREWKMIILSDGENDELELRVEQEGIDALLVKPLFRSGLYYSLRQFTDVQAGQQQEEEKDALVDLSGKRILVAEDNEINWEIAELTLSEFGLELEWAENGQICVDKISQSETGWYDAVLMDLRMPVMTGFEAARAIRMMGREDSGMPIIAISADAFEDDVQKCLDCGMNAHTSKPLDVEKIISLLSRYLG